MSPRSQAVLGIGGALLIVIGGLAAGVLTAGQLSFVSDTISTSASSTPARHTIQFTTASPIPASGSIVITPESGAYSLPASLDYTDIDFAVNGTDRDLAALASATEDGVDVNTGTGVITITLNSSTGIGAAETVVIEIGDHATYGDLGDVLPINPAIGVYRIALQTRDAGAALIDVRKAMIAIVAQVGVSGAFQNQPPTITNGLPSGLIAANNPAIEITVNTDEPAICRYATTTGVAYASMTGSFSAVTSFLYHFVFTPHQNQTIYNYYVRCIDDVGVFNTDDYVISFELDQTPISNTSIQTSGSASGRGGSGVLGGSDTLFLASISISGLFAPNSFVSIMRDGVLATRVPTLDNGRFAYSMLNLERGTYTILVFGEDGSGRKSSSFSSTLTVGQGTINSISNIMVSPTVVLEEESIGLGEDARAFGSAIPGSLVEVYVQAQTGDGEPTKYTATSTTGTWSIDLNTSDLKRGTYVIRARSLLSSGGASNYSIAKYLGVGEKPSACGTPDINGDEKINLVDFSIFLTDWGSDNGRSDFNCDQKVNLADFSIMLFNWTG